MSYRKGLLAAAAAAALAGGSAAYAEDALSLGPASELSMRPQMLQNKAPAAQRPLMTLLDQAGIGQPLRDSKINIFGHAQGSYTYNFNDPDDDLNPFRVFDFEHNKLLLNQIDLTIERRVDRKPVFDVGGRVEWLYGADAGIIHSNGLFDYYDGIRNPKNQLDLPQAYLDVIIPIADKGLQVRAGKFENFVGYESINPNSPNVVVDFYSRSLIFFNYPFTHTGVLLTYDVSSNVTLSLGVSRGDNQSVDDNNDAVSFLGSVNWVINSEFSLYVSNSTGPEKDDNSRDLRTSWDVTLYYTPANSPWRAAGNFYFVYEEEGGIDGDDAYLYALAGLVSYDINKNFTAKARVEWIHDDTGFRLGPVENIYEATLGLTIRPFADMAITDPLMRSIGENIKIRPEVRWDYSPDGPFDGDNHQVTGAVDIVVNF